MWFVTFLLCRKRYNDMVHFYAFVCLRAICTSFSFQECRHPPLFPLPAPRQKYFPVLLTASWKVVIWEMIVIRKSKSVFGRSRASCVVQEYCWGCTSSKFFLKHKLGDWNQLTGFQKEIFFLGTFASHPIVKHRCHLRAQISRGTQGCLLT